MLKTLSGVWDHSGVPMALEGSLLLCMPDEPGALENQISSKRFGEAVRENCIKEDPPPPNYSGSNLQELAFKKYKT